MARSQRKELLAKLPPATDEPISRVAARLFHIMEERPGVRVIFGKPANRFGDSRYPTEGIGQRRIEVHDTLTLQNDNKRPLRGALQSILGAWEKGLTAYVTSMPAREATPTRRHHPSDDLSTREGTLLSQYPKKERNRIYDACDMNKTERRLAEHIIRRTPFARIAKRIGIPKGSINFHLARIEEKLKQNNHT